MEILNHSFLTIIKYPKSSKIKKGKSAKRPFLSLLLLNRLLRHFKMAKYPTITITYFAHTLNNTVVAPPRMLIAFLENNLNEDGSVNIPVALRPYMGGKEKIGG